MSIVRGAEVLGGTGCSRSERRWPKGDGKLVIVMTGAPPGVAT
jgi:hypothetical protein